MDATPVTDYLKTNIQAMSEQEAIDAIKLVRSLPGGKKAIIQFSKSLEPKQRKAMHNFLLAIISPLDILNTAVERTLNLIHYLPF
jgi:hypothetical protein